MQFHLVVPTSPISGISDAECGVVASGSKLGASETCDQPCSIGHHDDGGGGGPRNSRIRF